MKNVTHILGDPFNTDLVPTGENFLRDLSNADYYRLLEARDFLLEGVWSNLGWCIYDSLESQHMRQDDAFLY